MLFTFLFHFTFKIYGLKFKISLYDVNAIVILLHFNIYLSNINKKILKFVLSYAILGARGITKRMKGKMKMKNKITILTKLLLDAMFYGGFLVCITLPISIKFYGQFNTYFEQNYIELCILFFLSGIFAILIIWELRKMFKTVLADDCFIMGNVISLKRMGNYSFMIVLITCIRLFLYLTPAVLVVILVFMIAGLFSKVLSLVFDKAVSYKLDNDLTI